MWPGRGWRGEAGLGALARWRSGGHLSRSMSSRPILPESSLAPHVAEKIHSFHRNVVDAITAAIERDPVVVVGMAQNPFVKKARGALQIARSLLALARGRRPKAGPKPGL